MAVNTPNQQQFGEPSLAGLVVHGHRRRMLMRMERMIPMARHSVFSADRRLSSRRDASR
jgi:hypothetical protein